jgi:hypothetical protein
MAECCGADTPLRSLSNVSRSRQTTGQHGRLLAKLLTLILRAISAALPRRTSPPPLRAPGPAATSTKLGRSRAESGAGPSIYALPDPNPPTQGAYAKGSEVACGCPHRVEPRAEGLRTADQAFRWPKNVPQLKILL